MYQISFRLAFSQVFQLKKGSSPTSKSDEPRLESPEKQTKKKKLERDPNILKEITFHPKNYPIHFAELTLDPNIQGDH